MKILRATPMQPGHLVWPLRPPTNSLVVAVKATFTLRHGAACELAPVQHRVTGDAHHDDDPSASLAYPSDLALVKPAGEFTLKGQCHVPGGAPAGVSVVAFRVGAVSRALAVFGDRVWNRAVPSQPVPFTQMPLRWERAFGGVGHPLNPVGVGLGELARRRLPNIEDRAQLIASPSDRPEPAGCAPLASTWPSRLRHAGTYNSGWRAKRWPWLPEDFDPAYFLAAPVSQRIQGFWQGDEAIELKNLRPDNPLVRTQLPGLRPGCLVVRAGTPGDRLVRVPLVLDTLHIDADAGELHAVWRGHLEGVAPDLANVRTLFVWDERLGAVLSDEAARALLLRTMIEDQAAQRASRPVPVPPPPDFDTQETTAIDPSVVSAALSTEGETLVLAPSVVNAALADDQRTSILPPASVIAAVMAAPLVESTAPTLTPPTPPTPAPPDELTAAINKLAAKLKALTVEPMPRVERAPETPLTPEAIERLRGAFKGAGAELPPELEAVLTGKPMPLPAAAQTPPPAPAPPPAPTVARQAVIDALARGESLARWDLTGADLSGLDLTGIDLAGAILARAVLRECVLDRATLSGAVLAGAVMTSARAVGARFDRADLTGVQWADGVLDGADLTRAVLDRAVLDRAVLRDARGKRVRMIGASLIGVDCTGAHFDEGDFDRALMDGANFSRASLVDASLQDASAARVVMEGANLEKLRGARGKYAGARFGRVRATGSRWTGALLDDAVFTGSTLERADFTDAVMRRVVFDGCGLRKARFVRAGMPSASLLACDGMHASFEAADLRAADLRGGSFHGAEFWQAQTDAMRLDHAVLTRTKLA